MWRSIMSLTNISLPDDDIPAMRRAAAYYRFENMGAFFRMCARTLIDHHRRGDKLIAPFRFEIALQKEVQKHASTKTKETETGQNHR
jgi:hypothetical protein